MDFLNKAYGQVTDLFKSMTPAARLTTGLLVATIVISLVFLFRQQAETADELLFGGRTLTNEEIASMSAALSKADLNGWDTTGNVLRVPRGQRHTYIAALVENNALPQDAGSAWEKMFTEHSPFENRKMGELRTRYALEKDLAFTIREFTGIDAASVKIQEIMNDATFPARPIRRAAVTVKAAGTMSLDANQIRMIRDVVAFGGGIERSEVVIADTNGHRSYEGPPKDGALSGDQNAYADTQRRYEQEFTHKIVDRLSMYPEAKVTVYVELDQTLEDRTTQIKYDEKPTPLKVRTTSSDERSVTTASSGRPGAEPNGVGNRSVAVNSTPDTESTLTESVEESENTSGVTQQITRKPGLVPKSVMVSVGIPKSYFKHIWKQQNPTPEGGEPPTPTPAELQALEAQEIATIQDAITPLIPKAPPGEDSYPRVKVTAYTDLPVPEPPTPSLVATSGTWFASNWQTIAMLGVALFGVVFLRSMIQSAQDSAMATVAAKSDTARRMAEINEGDEDDEDHESVAFGNSLRGRSSSKGRSLRDELTELVRDDPDAAANVLQNWITEAA
jgi:flagellar M-ring protein FliF